MLLMLLMSFVMCDNLPQGIYRYWEVLLLGIWFRSFIKEADCFVTSISIDDFIKSLRHDVINLKTEYILKRDSWTKQKLFSVISKLNSRHIFNLHWKKKELCNWWTARIVGQSWSEINFNLIYSVIKFFYSTTFI